MCPATAPDIVQTLWGTTCTIQFRPIRSLMTRLEFRQDHSNKNVFQRGSGATNQQDILTLDVIYFF